MPECNGNLSTLSYKELKALRQIAKAVVSRHTATKLDEALKVKTRPMGKLKQEK